MIQKLNKIWGHSLEILHLPPHSTKLFNNSCLKKYEASTFTLYDKRTGDVLEHFIKFSNFMGPHARNKELYLREFSKPLTNQAYN